MKDIDAAVETQRALVQGSVPVSLLRAYNDTETRHVLGDDDETRCLILLEFVAPELLLDAYTACADGVLASLGAERLPDSAGDRWYAQRYQVETMMADRNHAPGQGFDTIEVSLPWASAAAAAEELEAQLSTVAASTHLHFSHAYPSGACLYVLMWFEAPDAAAVLGQVRSAWQLAMDIVVRHGGQPGHHHGIGSVRANRYQLSADAAVHRALKAVLDPQDVLRSALLGGATDRMAQ